MSDFPSSLSGLPGEEKNIIFNSGTTKCSLCPTMFLLSEENGDTLNENVKMRQFLHNLFQQLNLSTMCPCLNPPSCPRLQLPMCRECSEVINMLWTCDSTMDSLSHTRVSLLESLRHRALLGVLEEGKKTETRTTAQPPPPPIVIPEMQSLQQIKNAIASGGMWDCPSNFQLDSKGEANNHNQIVNDPSFQQPTVDNLSSHAQPSTITRMETSYNVSGMLNAITGAEEKIAGADGHLYGIIPKKYVEGEDDVDIIKCFRVTHGQKDRMFYMCRRCRFTVVYKTFRFLKGQVTPYQRMKLHVQNCRVGTHPTGIAFPPKLPFLDGDLAAKMLRPMPTLKSAPGVNAARGGGSEQANVDTDGTIYKVCRGGRWSKLGILTCFRYFEGRSVEELVYMCRYCKFKLAANHKKKLVGQERPFYKMKIHVINCRGQSPQRMAIDYSCKRSNIQDAGFQQGSPTQEQNKKR